MMSMENEKDKVALAQTKIQCGAYGPEELDIALERMIKEIEKEQEPKRFDGMS